MRTKLLTIAWWTFQVVLLSMAVMNFWVFVASPHHRLEHLTITVLAVALSISQNKIRQLQTETRQLHLQTLAGTRICEYCGGETRITTAGCDKCDMEDK